jgi:hypothetical protein
VVSSKGHISYHRMDKSATEVWLNVELVYLIIGNP